MELPGRIGVGRGRGRRRVLTSGCSYRRSRYSLLKDERDEISAYALRIRRGRGSRSRSLHLGEIIRHLRRGEHPKLLILRHDADLDVIGADLPVEALLQGEDGGGMASSSSMSSLYRFSRKVLALVMFLPIALAFHAK